jgi:tetratricopeptide (TPR) repeat protein
VIDLFVELGEMPRVDVYCNLCVVWLGVVLGLGTDWGARDLSILASRRIGLAQLHLGNVQTARESYERSMRDARMIDDREGRIIAHIGLGHVLSVQGRWADATTEYMPALELCRPDDHQLAGQVEMNLAMTAREIGDYGTSAAWLQKAHLRWAHFTRAERSVWFNSQGMLLIESGDTTGARTALEQALAHSGSYFDTAMILDNLANLSIREEDLAKAESYARRAEEFAVVGNADRALAEIYIRLASITRLRGEENGIGFLEKAIELSRAEGYHQAHARALQEYALLRERMQDFNAARELRLEAASILEAIS